MFFCLNQFKPSAEVKKEEWLGFRNRLNPDASPIPFKSPPYFFNLLCGAAFHGG